jgi:hypothetical protein
VCICKAARVMRCVVTDAECNWYLHNINICSLLKKEIQRDDPLKHLLINETFREYKLKTIRELGIFIKNRNTLSKKSILYEHVLFSILETI